MKISLLLVECWPVQSHLGLDQKWDFQLFVTFSVITHLFSCHCKQ